MGLDEFYIIETDFNYPNKFNFSVIITTLGRVLEWHNDITAEQLAKLNRHRRAAV